MDSSKSIKMELIHFREHAEKGYKLASQKYSEIRDTLREEEKKIKETNRKQNELSLLQNSSIIDEQMKALTLLKTRVENIGKDIIALHAQQKEFSIVIYGRTMVGKSTLMETLTHGDGKSIGKGAQRTTLDVRSYYWNGLKIIDVPGVCSFESEEDDKIAFEAAKSADLVLFLITDDAPQAGEAKALAQIRRLGKPVLGIINVKIAFDLNKRKLALRDLQRKLANTNRLDDICAQFKDFAIKFNQEWQNIPFVYTHLDAAFQSQPERGNDLEVYQTSNFTQVEQFILEKVCNDGKFLRVKTFIDSISVPMENIIAAIYTRAGNTLKESGIWRDKQTQFDKWRSEFIESTKRRILRLNNDFKAILDNEIDKFVETHYEDKDAATNWQRHIEMLDFPSKYNVFLQELADECNRKRKSLSGELMTELNYAFSNRMNLNSMSVDEITDYKTGVQIGSAILSVPLFFLGPVGIVTAIALNVGASLFKDKQERIREAKDKMIADLTVPSHKMIDEMQANVVKVINETIIKGDLNKFSDSLRDMARMLARLGSIQTKLALVLGRKFNDLNIDLLTNAIEYSQRDYIEETPAEIEEPAEENNSFSSFFGSAKKIISRAEKNKNNLFGFISKKVNNVKLDNVREAVNFSVHANILTGVKYLTSGIKFIARVPGEEFLVVSDSFEVDSKKLSSILGNKFVYLPILQSEKPEAVEKILGCSFYAVKFPLSNYESTTVIVPKGNVTDTNLKLAQQIAEVPIVRE